jgi:uncharacterized protein (DUF2141 family)
MKSLLLTFAIASISFFSSAQNTLTIEINGLKTNEGTVMIKLLDANEKVVKTVKSKVTDKQCMVKIEDLASGSYAVQYFHDENDNGKMDTGSFGKPVEGYGYSNDARGFFGPADFDDQVFEMNENLKITLKTVN